MKNYANSLTVNGFDILVKDGKVRLKDLQRLAKKLNLPTAGKSPKKFLSSDEGVKILKRSWEPSLGKYASQPIAIKYAEYISVSFSLEIDYAIGLYNSSQCLREMVLYAQTSMWEAVRAAGGLGIDYANEYDLITSIVLGCTSFEFVEDKGLPEDCCYLEYMTDVQLAALYSLLRLNALLINEGVSLSQRREKLREKFYSNF